MIAGALAIAVTAARLPPIDQCAGDASFVRFRSELRNAVARRDAKALVGIVADDVMVDFDGSNGPDEFARVWKLDGPQPHSSLVWRELATVLQLGCARVGPARIMPSLPEQLSDEDQFEKMIALPGAILRRSPKATAAPTRSLSFHVVRLLEGDAPDGWAHVSLSDGTRGYVSRKQLRAALDFRAQFEKIEGRWRLTSFVEGD